ncbi:hypothetical protein [Jeongeupia chitinilytica]|uniref:Uncharacterized protein n=1 Tax=Jeongeupia chitinilytica TaxID=1041641 RepID=A0ABQ3H2Q9_9NEIS|nr:hypothetical protein [Jeongeupia chitinilytica]GHD66528.1 hypothetical protein GCM10007350_28880 [Jeongeupia chitinilytica]
MHIRLCAVRFLKRHPLATLALMAVSFIGFGAVSVNLVMLLSANLNLLWQHGWLAVMNGAIEQLAELLLHGVLALLLYLVFKLCEKLLVEKLSNTSDPHS